MYAIDPSSLAEETVQQQLLHLAKDIMGYPKPAATLAVPSPRPPQGAPGGPQGGPPGGPHGADSQEVENVRLQEGGRSAEGLLLLLWCCSCSSICSSSGRWLLLPHLLLLYLLLYLLLPSLVLTH